MTGHRFTVSGFADEIGPDLDEQLAVLDSLGIDHLDLRGVDGTNVLDLSDEQVDRCRAAFDDHGIQVTSIGSPIGKIDVTDEFEPHLERFETAIEMAKTFDTEYVRVFSYYIPEGDDPADHREEVIRRTKVTVARAEAAGVTLLHENERHIYGDTPERCRDLLSTVDSPNFRAVFDPANFVVVGVSPFPEGLLDVVEYVEQIHVKDARFGDGVEIVPVGDGDANVRAALAAFARRGFEGPLSLEPHLADSSGRYGDSRPEAYEIGAEALFDCLEQIGARYA